MAEGTSLPLGPYLASIRTTKGMTLREVEEASKGEVSNGYLSQLENGRIIKPSPNVLHALAEVYAISYELLMEKAGYITTAGKRSDKEKHGRVATFADDKLTKEEEEALLVYLAFLRSQKKGKPRE